MAATEAITNQIMACSAMRPTVALSLMRPTPTRRVENTSGAMIMRMARRNMVASSPSPLVIALRVALSEINAWQARPKPTPSSMATSTHNVMPRNMQAPASAAKA